MSDPQQVSFATNHDREFDRKLATREASRSRMSTGAKYRWRRHYTRARLIARDASAWKFRVWTVEVDLRALEVWRID